MNLPSIQGEAFNGNCDVMPSIVVVDDEPEAAREMVHGLSRAGLNCIAISNPWIALQMLAGASHPQIAVLDIRMPELDGLQLVERLKNIRPADVPDIILVSGTADIDDAITAMRLGIRRMLRKPLKVSALVYEVKLAIAESDRRNNDEERTLIAAPSLASKISIDTLVVEAHCRSRLLPEILLSDHCWKMFLELYEMRKRNGKVSLTSLALVSNLPMATAIRKIHQMKDLSLVTYQADNNDKRRTFVALSDAGYALAEKFITRLEADIAKMKGSAPRT